MLTFSWKTADKFTGIIKLPAWGGIKQYKWYSEFIGFPLKWGSLFGLVMYSNPWLTDFFFCSSFDLLLLRFAPGTGKIPPSDVLVRWECRRKSCQKEEFTTRVHIATWSSNVKWFFLRTFMSLSGKKKNVCFFGWSTEVFTSPKVSGTFSMETLSRRLALDGSKKKSKNVCKRFIFNKNMVT